MVFLYSTAISAIFFVQSRHRTLKVDPFLVPLAVIGVAVVGVAFAGRSAIGGDDKGLLRD